MPTSALFASEPSRTAMRVAQIVAALLLVLAMAVLPIAGLRLPQFPFFLPGVLTTAVMIDLFIAYLLLGQFIVSAAPAIPVLAAAFVVRSMFIFGFTVASPGVILGDGHLLLGAQTASWMLIAGQSAFPLLVAAYVLVERGARRSLPADQVVPTLGLAVLLTLSVGGILFAAIALGNDALPPIIDGASYHKVVTSGVAPAVLLLDAAVLLLVVFMLRGRSVMQMWLAVTILASLLGGLVITVGGERQSLGWYASHLIGLCGSAILLAALLHEMTLLYARLAVVKDKLAIMAETDGLTALANRRRFDAMLHTEWLRAVRDGTSISLLMIDIDRFKSYNDRYGHPAGDECLRRVAATIAATAKRPADLPARYGGEEFAMILPETDRLGARHFAEEVRRAVHALAIGHEDGIGGAVTVSIGVAARQPIRGETESSLIVGADAALYRAKTSGRNRVVAEGDPRVVAAA